MKYRLVAVFIAGFLAGVLFRSFWDFGWAFILLIILLGGGFLLLRSIKIVRSGEYLLAGLFLLGVGLGVFRYDLADQRPDQEFLDSVAGEKIVAEGIVVDEPDERETHTRLAVKLEQVGSSEVSSKVLIFTQHFPKFSYGDRLKIEGKIEQPRNFSPSTGAQGQISDPRDFDWVTYLAKDNIYYQLFYPRIELVESGQGFFLKRWLFALKSNFLEAISAVIPEPEVSLAGGLIVGAKQSMGKELLEDFRQTGVIHIVVLSGYNVTIVADSIVKFFGSFLSQTISFSLGLVSIIFFALMTGAAPATVRASIMAILVLVARKTGRNYAITAALIAAGFLMVLVNPKILVFDTGFQLSFIATLGLIYFPPIIEKYFKFIPQKFGLRQLAVLTSSAQLAVLPWILYKMGNLSLVALPVNLLILLFVPATMLFGFFTGLAGFIWYYLSLPFGWLTYALLWYELKMVKIFASLPFASIELKYFPLWLALLIYSLMAFWIIRLSNRVNKNGRAEPNLEAEKQGSLRNLGG